MLRPNGSADLGARLMDDEIYDRIIFLADPELSEPVPRDLHGGWIDAGLGANLAIGAL